MDAVEFLMNKSRFCKNGNCEECEIYDECDAMLDKLTKEDAEKIVSAIEQYAKEHPIKTRQSEFLKMFPNAPIYDGVVVVDPCSVDKEFESQYCADCSSNCRRDYWLQEVER